MRRRAALLPLFLFAAVLAACPKKDAPAVDAAVVAEDAAVVVLIDEDASDTGVAPFTTATKPHAAVAVRHADAGVDAGTAPEPPGGGGLASGECCCEVPGQGVSEQPQSDCTKGGHGQCVKKVHCALARGKTKKTDRQCCCRIEDKQDVISQSVCQEPGLGGRCVRMTECTR